MLGVGNINIYEAVTSEILRFSPLNKIIPHDENSGRQKRKEMSFFDLRAAFDY